MKKYIVFNLLTSDFAVEISKIKEVIATSEITPIPLNSSHIKGLINLRGEIIAAVDLRQRMQMKADVNALYHTIIICEVHGKTIGVIVDSVSNVTSLKSSDLKPVPDQFREFKNSYIDGVGSVDDKLLLLLNLESVLDLGVATQTHLKIA